MEQTLIEQAWSESHTVVGFDPKLVRLECCGAFIFKNAYGDTNSKFGWEVEHVYPYSKGGKNDPINLRAMQWENNRSKGDDFPVYKAVVANNNDNVYNTRELRINDF